MGNRFEFATRIAFLHLGYERFYEFGSCAVDANAPVIPYRA